MDIYSSFANRFEKTREEEFSLEEYLALCKNDPSAYATAGERMLAAIGEPSKSIPATTRACRGSSRTRLSRSIPPSVSFTEWRK
jgi:predicted Ser/Thr protein kinase